MSINVYNLDNGLDLSFSDDERAIIINVNSNANLNLNFKNGSYNVFIKHVNEEAIDYNEVISLENGAIVNLMYLGLALAKTKQTANLKVGFKSTLNIYSAYLVKHDKEVYLNCYNVGKHSEVNMDNSCIIHGSCKLLFAPLGKIFNGNKGSIHHQKTRCLTLGSINQAKASPLLSIEENDVEASHALALGTIDPEQLYYMQSRGLSYEASIKLLFESYLMPDLSYLNDQQLIDDISKLINEKVVSL